MLAKLRNRGDSSSAERRQCNEREVVCPLGGSKKEDEEEVEGKTDGESRADILLTEQYVPQKLQLRLGTKVKVAASDWRAKT
jgi:hypothetical protein